LNYITTPLDGPRKPPSENQWEQHHQPINEIFKRLKPNLVVVLGFRMFDRWEYDSPMILSEGPIILNAGRDKTRYFQLDDNRKALIYGMRHPSSGFSWRTEYLSLKEAISIA